MALEILANTTFTTSAAEWLAMTVNALGEPSVLKECATCGGHDETEDNQISTFYDVLQHEACFGEESS